MNSVFIVIFVKENFSSLNKFKCSLLNFQIKDISNHINFLKNRVFTIRNELEKCLPQRIIIDLLKHQIVLNNTFLNNDRGRMKKLNSAISEQSSAQTQNLNLHRVCEIEKSDPWFVNLTHV